MLPFTSKKFEFPATADARQKLASILSQDKWSRLKYKLEGDKVTIEHMPPKMFRNSWNPVFQGKFIQENGKQVLVGFFRVNWLVLIFILLMLGFIFSQLLSVYFSPEVMPGHIEGWRSDQMMLYVQMLGMFALVNIIGWIAGTIYRKRILQAIQDSTQA